MTNAASFADALRALLPPAIVITDPDLLPQYGRDFLGERGQPSVVVRAGSEEEIAAVLRFAQAQGVPVVPRSAGTNVSYGFMPAPGRIMLDLQRMNRVLHIDPEQRLAVVEPGVINGDLNNELLALRLCYSPDPASAAMSSIGGNISTNAGGPRCLKYGVTVHHVSGARCVLAGGDVLTLDAADAGPDLLGAFIGSEGTLGIVTQGTLRLRPLASVTRTLLAVFDRAEDAVEAVSATIAAGLVPAAMEYFDRACARIVEAYSPSGYPTDADGILLVDVDGTEEEVAHDLPAVEVILARTAREVLRADDDMTRKALWRGRLLAAVALTSGGRQMYFGDVTVPRQHLPELQRKVTEIARRRGVNVIFVGHIGDGNVHPSFSYDANDAAQVAAVHAADDDVVEAALAMGGTITGEHGVGNFKRHHMPRRFTPPEIAAMRALKRAFDPSALLNPEVLLPEVDAGEPALPRFDRAIQRLLQTRRAGTRWQGEAPPPPDAPDAAARAQISAANLTATTSAAIPLATLRDQLATAGFHCTVPAAVADARTLGAALSSPAARAGVRAALLAVRATLPDGQAVRFGSDAVKDVAGYDLKRLYVGSGGEFGTVSEVTLRITPIRGEGR